MCNIGYVNIRGLNSSQKTGEILDLMKEKSIKIMAFTETHLKENDAPVLTGTGMK